MLRRIALGALSAVITLACTDDGTAPAALGSIAIVVSMTGPEPDSDGFGLAIDQVPSVKVVADTTLYFTGLLVGSHTLHLTGLAVNCSMRPLDLGLVEVAANDTTLVPVAIECLATTGALEISDHTEGPLGPGPPYYWSYVNGEFMGLFYIGTPRTIDSLPPGATVVSLDLLRNLDNCTTADSIRANVVAGQVTHVVFDVVCVVNWGDVYINVPTTGPNQPPLLTFQIDDGTMWSAGTSPNSSFGLPFVKAGPHTITISGVTSNCTLDGPTTRDIDVPVDADLAVDFVISCL